MFFWEFSEIFWTTNVKSTSGGVLPAYLYSSDGKWLVTIVSDKEDQFTLTVIVITKHKLFAKTFTYLTDTLWAENQEIFLYYFKRNISMCFFKKRCEHFGHIWVFECLYFRDSSTWSARWTRKVSKNCEYCCWG